MQARQAFWRWATSPVLFSPFILREDLTEFPRPALNSLCSSAKDLNLSYSCFRLLSNWELRVFTTRPILEYTNIEEINSVGSLVSLSMGSISKGKCSDVLSIVAVATGATEPIKCC